MLALRSWERIHFEQARYILAECLGPLLRPGDSHQQAKETRGTVSLHWELPFEGERTWLKNQN